MPRPAPTSPVSSAGPHPPRSRQMVGRASGRAARADRAHVPQPRRRAPHRAAGATPPTALPSWSASQVPVVRPWRTWPGPGAPGAGRPRRGRPGRGRRREGTPIASGWPAAWWRARAIHSPSLRCSPARASMRRWTALPSGARPRPTSSPEGDRAHPGQPLGPGPPTNAANTHTHTPTPASAASRSPLRQAEHLLGGARCLTLRSPVKVPWAVLEHGETNSATPSLSASLGAHPKDGIRKAPPSRSSSWRSSGRRCGSRSPTP